MPHLRDDEREWAIQYLIENIPVGTLVRIIGELHKDPDWLIAQHSGIGMQARNLLCSSGKADLHPSVVNVPRVGVGEGGLFQGNVALSEEKRSEKKAVYAE